MTSSYVTTMAMMPSEYMELFNGTNQSINVAPVMECCSADCAGGVDDCDVYNQMFLRANKLEFSTYHVIRIILTWIIFIISAAGNMISLWGLLPVKTLSRSGRRTFTNTQMIMLNITLADLAYVFFILPVDAVWNYTLQWKVGDAACKILHVLKYFAMYSSSGMIMAMVLDRMLAILRRTTHAQQKKQTRICVAVAWLFAVANSIAPGILFSVLSHKPCADKCPEIPTAYQCVDFGLVTNLRFYYIYTMMISFFIPITSIVVCQTLIGVEIAKMAVRDREMMGRRKSETTKSINKARQKSMLLTILITTMFCLCWGPYYVRGLYYWFNPNAKVSRNIELWTFVSMYLNPCLHPLFFAIFMKDVRRPFLLFLHRMKSMVCYCRNGDSNDVIQSSCGGHNRMLTVLTKNQSMIYNETMHENCRSNNNNKSTEITELVA